MIRALWYFAIAAGIAGLAAALASISGDVVVSLGDAEVGLSVATAFGILALILGAGFGAVWLFNFVVRGPANVSNFWASRRQVRGYEAFSRGMLAVAAGDAAGARRYAERAHNLLDKPAMTLLLTAQAAQLAGDASASGKAFQTMLASPEARGLALKGLFDQAMAARNFEAALGHAIDALSAAPDTPWAFEGRFALEARLGNYEAALETLDRGLGQGLLKRPDARRRRAVLLTALAQAEAAKIPEPGELRDEEAVEPGAPSVQEMRSNALRHAIEARDLAPDLVPAAVIAARLVAEDGRARRAQKIIEDTWAKSPHPGLADVFLDLFPDETAMARLKRARALAQFNPDHVETRVLLARAAIAARDWPTARDALAPYTSPFPTKRICLLMAEIEEGDDTGRAREWLSRAVNAPPAAQWVAPGYRSPEWVPVVPATGAFDALEWRTPVDALVPQATSTEEAMAAAAQTVVLPAEPQAPAAERKTAAPAASAPASASETKPAPKPVQAAADSDADADVFMPRPPDDPGPVSEDEEAERPVW